MLSKNRLDVSRHDDEHLGREEEDQGIEKDRVEILALYFFPEQANGQDAAGEACYEIRDYLRDAVQGYGTEAERDAIKVRHRVGQPGFRKGADEKPYIHRYNRRVPCKYENRSRAKSYREDKRKQHDLGVIQKEPYKITAFCHGACRGPEAVEGLRLQRECLACGRGENEQKTHRY